MIKSTNLFPQISRISWRIYTPAQTSLFQFFHKVTSNPDKLGQIFRTLNNTLKIGTNKECALEADFQYAAFI
jgi:hypothetical protein